MLSCLEGHVMCLKGLIAAVFEMSEPLHLLCLMGMSAPSLHRESTDSLILVWNFRMPMTSHDTLLC